MQEQENPHRQYLTSNTDVIVFQESLFQLSSIYYPFHTLQEVIHHLTFAYRKSNNTVDSMDSTIAKLNVKF